MTGLIAALGGLPFLPEGTTLPPVPYLVAVLLAGGGVAVAFRRRAPEVSAAHVLGLVPWIALGAAFHVLYVVGALPQPLAPLGGSPTVYLATGTLAGGVWLGAEAVDGGDRTPACSRPPERRFSFPSSPSRSPAASLGRARAGRPSR